MKPSTIVLMVIIVISVIAGQNIEENDLDKVTLSIEKGLDEERRVETKEDDAVTRILKSCVNFGLDIFEVVSIESMRYGYEHKETDLIKVFYIMLIIIGIYHLIPVIITIYTMIMVTREGIIRRRELKNG